MLQFGVVTNGKGITAHPEKCWARCTEGNKDWDIEKDKQSLAKMDEYIISFVLPNGFLVREESHPWAQAWMFKGVNIPFIIYNNSPI